MNMQEKNISANNFEQCIKCTVCTVYCPVVPVNPLYPGPKQAGPDGERLRLKKGIFFDDTLKYCLNCKRCEVACPSGVRIGDIIQAARIKYNTQPPKLRDMMLASTDLMGSVATKVAPAVNMTLGLKPVKAVMDGVPQILFTDFREVVPQECKGLPEVFQPPCKLLPWMLCQLQLSAARQRPRKCNECARIRRASS